MKMKWLALAMIAVGWMQGMAQEPGTNGASASPTVEDIQRKIVGVWEYKIGDDTRLVKFEDGFCYFKPKKNMRKNVQAPWSEPYQYEIILNPKSNTTIKVVISGQEYIHSLSKEGILTIEGKYRAKWIGRGAIGK